MAGKQASRRLTQDTFGTGETGFRIIRSLVGGVREPGELAAMRDSHCKKSEEEIEKALTGTWREEHLFVLAQSLDMSKFPNEKHFCSWLGLAPRNEISGGKILVSRTLKTKNRAGQAFRLATVSIMRTDCVFGAFYRRMKSRLGPAQATVATAHLIARVVYRMLRYQAEYEPLSMSEYEKQYHERQIKYLEKKAAKFGFQLAPAVA